jgi:hypothetical protein
MQARKQINWFVQKEKYLPSYSEYVNYWGQVANENLYIMDNHRCALFHWLNLKTSFHYLHIDAHYDAYSDQNSTEELALLLQPNLSPESFLSLENERLQKKLIRWDNYLPIFYALKGELIKSSHFFTQKIGIPPRPTGGGSMREYGPWELVTFLQSIKRTQMDETPWIINIDLDYFFQKQFPRPIFEQEFLHTFFHSLRTLQNDGLCASITWAISPECCPSKDASINLLNFALSHWSVADVLKC